MDKRFINWYQSFFDARLWEKSMEAVSVIGNGFNWVIAMMITFVLCLLTRKLAAALLVVSSGWVYLLNFLLKDMVQRPRPLPTEVRVIGEQHGTLGFPSGHVTSYVALFGIVFVLVTLYVKLIWLKRLLQAISILLILAVGPSRMTLGMHWPSDVGAGYLLGTIFLLIALPAFFFIKHREKKTD